MNNTNYILNSSHYDTSTKSFKYRLPISQKFENKKVALTYCSIYKQFFNISSDYGNNTLKFTWIDGTEYDITIKDGNYTISQINEYIHYILYTNKLYVVDSANSNLLFFVSLFINPTQYGSQLAFFAVPNSADATTAGYIKPSGATWNYPTTAIAPTLQFSDSFGELIGFSGGSYGNTSANIVYDNDKTPQIAKVNALQISCNLINNEYTSPNDIIGSMSMSGEFGDLMIFNAGFPLYSKISARNYEYIEVYFSDQNGNKLSIRDTEVLIMLSVVE